MRTGRDRLVETLWDLIIEDRAAVRPTTALIEESADRILGDMKDGII